MANESRKRVLMLLAESPIDEFERITQGIQKRTLRALIESGLATYRPYGKPPTWAITAEGRKELRKELKT